MKTTHTSGPWEFVDNSLVGPKIDGKPIWLRPVILRSEVGVRNSDAELIRAAPDLLKALTDLRDSIEAGKEPALGDANRAIRKAAGGAA